MDDGHNHALISLLLEWGAYSTVRPHNIGEIDDGTNKNISR